MKIKRLKIYKLLLFAFIICLTFFPKLNIISIGSKSTGVRLEDLIIAITTIAILPNIKTISLEDKKFRNILIVFGFYVLACFIALIYGVILKYVTPLMGMLFFIRRIEYFVCIYFGYCYFYFDKKNEKLIKILDIFIIFNFVLCMLQQFGILGSVHGGKLLQTLSQNRPSSIFNGAYEMGGFLLLITPFYIKKVINKDHLIKNIINLLLILVCIGISQSRISLLIYFFILAIVLYRKFCKTKKIKIIAFMTALILLLMGIIFVKYTNFAITNRLKEISFTNAIETVKCSWKYKDFDNYLKTNSWITNLKCYQIGNDHSWNMRASKWIQLLDGVIRNPYFGMGPSITGAAADGEYIRILSESGIIGFGMWILLIVLIFIDINKYKCATMCLVSKYGLYSLLIGSIFIDLFSASKVAMLFWFILGITYARMLVMNGEKESEECNNN